MNLSLSGFLNKLLTINPFIEVAVRRLYWSNIKHLYKYGLFLNKQTKTSSNVKIDFNNVLKWLRVKGVSKGSTLVVHSSYESLESSGISPPEIIEMLIDFLGSEGTLAMPAIRKYSSNSNVYNYLENSEIEEVTIYNPRKTKISTGALPFYMLRDERSFISRHPLNSMVAIGRLAESMMENNLNGYKPTPCGVNSSWNYCIKNNAYIVGIGINLVHSLTIVHVAEDTLDDNWPIKNWYRDRTFKIIDRDFESTRIVRERRPKYGTLYFAERTLQRDLLREGILEKIRIDNVKVEILNSIELMNFLKRKNQNGYPYFGFSKKQKK